MTGVLPFDRTMKMSSGEAYERAVVKDRLPFNLDTVNKLLERNVDPFLQFERNLMILMIRLSGTSSRCIVTVAKSCHTAGGIKPSHQPDSADDEKTAGHSAKNASAPKGD